MSAPDNADDKDFVMHDSDSGEGETDNYEHQVNETGDELFRKLFSLPIILSAISFLILVILLIVVISRSQDLAEKNQISAIEERLDQLETVFTSKLDQVSEELNRLEQTMASKSAPSAKASPPPEKEPNDVKPKIHKVQAGDSLYQISLHYGLTVEQLCSYNKLDPYAKIHPGQELKLAP